MIKTLPSFGWVIILTLLPIIGCNTGIKKFRPVDLQTGDKTYTPFFNKEIKLLKDQWPELYTYLKQGHLLKEEGGLSYIYSYEFYKFIKRNQLKIYETPFLETYDQFIKVFGEAKEVSEFNNRINISYFQFVIGDSCSTCQHDSFGYRFDAESKKLVKR